jgi:hypothetical protein
VTTNQSMLAQRQKPPRRFNNSWMYRSLDAVLTASLRPRGGPGQLAWSVIRPRSSITNRISSMVNLLDYLSPGLATRWGGALVRDRNFPLHGYQARLMAYGSGATVFLLENGQDQKVLKVFRRSLGRPAPDVWEVARQFQVKHDTLTRWFNDPFEIVVPSHFLVLHSPLMGAAAAAVLQPYIAGTRHDIFRDYTKAEAVQLLQSDPLLKAQWIDFSTRFLKSMEETDTCFDIVGRENLMLLEHDNRLCFKIVDNGLFDLAAIQAKSPAIYGRYQAHVEQLKQIMNEV